MSKVIEKLKQIQADSWVLNVKFHNYHWNVRGDQFYFYHRSTKSAYEMFFEIFDYTAERIIQLGGKAIVCPKELVEMAKVENAKKDSFDCEEIVELALKDYKYILKEFHELADLADEAKDRVTSALAYNYIVKYEKEIWMVEQTLE
ncbi:MAG: DNA starvation/stationary phase protection protein [Campylobacteraceae bacterium]|nr:DNA starvation/stationary phase protection protein [Campylobacteraceae bacterium]